MDMIITNIKNVVKSVLCITTAYNNRVRIFLKLKFIFINEHSKQEHSVSTSYFTNIKVQYAEKALAHIIEFAASLSML